MPEPIAYFRGKFVPFSQLLIPPYDSGFMLGVTVAEQMRTFGGTLFRWKDHELRLRRSLEIVGLADQLDRINLHEIATHVVEQNRALIDPRDDLGLTVFVTPGNYPTYCPNETPEPAIGIHSYPLPFALWADKYDRGQAVVVSAVTQVPSRCWPRELKCRSRMHYYLADREARRIDPAARAILLDDGGFVNEASTANVLAYLPGEGLVSPPLEDILPGVSLRVVEELCTEIGVTFSYRPLSQQELLSAREVLLTSTSPCVLPVASIDGRAVGDGHPGDVFRSLLAAWSRMVGIDIYAQAVRR